MREREKIHESDWTRWQLTKKHKTLSDYMYLYTLSTMNASKNNTRQGRVRTESTGKTTRRVDERKVSEWVKGVWERWLLHITYRLRRITETPIEQRAATRGMGDYFKASVCKGGSKGNTPQICPTIIHHLPGDMPVHCYLCNYDKREFASSCNLHHTANCY